jgi:hypothetical protein
MTLGRADDSGPALIPRDVEVPCGQPAPEHNIVPGLAARPYLPLATCRQCGCCMNSGHLARAATLR